jgi:hypothetical protein
MSGFTCVGAGWNRGLRHDASVDGVKGIEKKWGLRRDLEGALVDKEAVAVE